MLNGKDDDPIDVGIALRGLFSYVGDVFGYYQDLIVEEGYLGTSRDSKSSRPIKITDFLWF